MAPYACQRPHMFIHSLTIKNLKRLHDLTLDFTNSDGSTRMWTVLIGENGTGKTSILQAIALAAAGQLRVNDLAGNSVVHMLDRRQKESLQIEARFGLSPSLAKRSKAKTPRAPMTTDVTLTSKVTLNPKETSLRATSQYDEALIQGDDDPLDTARAKESPGWFVIGFGVRRSLPMAGRIPDLARPSVDRMKSLFDVDHALTSTSFLSHFGSGTKKARAYSNVLKSAIINTGVLPTDLADLELRGQGGVSRAADLLERERFQQKLGTLDVKIPAIALAHGYQSTIAWIADLVGHILLESNNNNIDPKHFQGLVLIDEIDLYLHPTWQSQLIPALRKTFPRLQFVATTHSPVVLGALEPDEVVRLEADSHTGHVRRITPDADTGIWDPVDKPADLHTQPDPRLMTATELYRDYFGVDRLTLNPQGENLRIYTSLATHPDRNEYQEQEMLRLREKLVDAGMTDLVTPTIRKNQPAAAKIPRKAARKTVR